MHTRSLALFMTLGLLAPSVASADVITGEPARPMDCPLGAMAARPMRGHGFYCAVAPACTADADCTGGGTCQDTAVCVLPGSDVAPYACAADGSCVSGECMRARRCVPPLIGTTPARAPSPPPPPVPAPSPSPAPADSGSCSATQGTRSPTPWVLGLVAIALALRRRAGA